MGDRVRLRVLVRGHVQGVSFRYSTCREARGLGVAGWVRNRADGSVEIEAEGEVERVRQLLAYTRRGPPGARVEGIEEEPLPLLSTEPDFSIR
jgi:acylphosphatase